jgi:hypothetical protein
MILKLAALIEAEVELGLLDRTLICELRPLICKTHNPNNPKTLIWSLPTPIAHAPFCRGSEVLVARDAHGSNCCMVANVKGRN